MVKAGDKLPSIIVDGETPDKPDNKVNIAEFFAQYKKAILIGVPGAFTPACSKSHVPSYIENYEKIKAKGVEKIAVVSVNDSWVMTAWKEYYKAGEKITFLADPRAEFVTAADLVFHAHGLGGNRSKRFAAIIENGIITRIDVEPTNGGLSCSLGSELLNHL